MQFFVIKNIASSFTVTMNSRIIITWNISSSKSFPFFVGLVLLLPIVAYSLEQTHLTDLRKFTVKGLGARILTSKGVIEDLMNNISIGFGKSIEINIIHV